jgi:hypothetical protein
MLSIVSTRANTRALLPGLILAVAAAGLRAQESESGDKWSFEIIPSVWGAGIEGREAIGTDSANVSSSAKDLFDFANVGGSLRLTGHGGRLGWYGEASYVGLEDEAASGAGAARVKSSQTLAELGMSLDIVQALGLSAYAGIRYQDQNAVLESAGQRQDSDHSWVDGLVGVECPTGSGRMMNLFEVSRELSTRLTSIFLRNAEGRRAVYGGTEKFQSDPHWRDLILFYEYFHGDNGAGLGASHQTGWTGIISRLIQLYGAVDGRRLLEAGLRTRRPAAA